MCGRFYLDNDLAEELERVIRQIDAKLTFEKLTSQKMDMTMIQTPEETSGINSAHGFHPTGDIYPSSDAPVLTARGRAISASIKRWGFPGFQKSSVIFNARSETAAEKRMFQDSVLHRRCAVPVTWFYEWDKSKNKFEFFRKDRPILFLAGFYNRYADGDHFVILTTGANRSMKEIHDRMPLTIDETELLSWMEDDSRVSYFLTKGSCMLERRSEYDQQTLPFL